MRIAVKLDGYLVGFGTRFEYFVTGFGVWTSYLTDDDVIRSDARMRVLILVVDDLLVRLCHIHRKVLFFFFPKEDGLIGSKEGDKFLRSYCCWMQSFSSPDKLLRAPLKLAPRLQ